MDTTTTKDFAKALEALEGQLETPVMAGEAVGFLARVHTLAADARREFLANAKANHRELLHSIAEEDPELLSRVDQLREKDAELRDRWERFERLAGSLQELTQQAEPDEAKMGGHLQDLLEDGIKLIVQTRSQEKALTTWYVESINRDGGEVD